MRQCNLQQFIQQTGAALPTPPQPGRASPVTQVRAVLGKVGGYGSSHLADLYSSQDLLSSAGEDPLQGAPKTPVPVPTLSLEGRSTLWHGPSPVQPVSSLPCGMGPPQLSLLSLCLPHSHYHEAELLEVAAPALDQCCGSATEHRRARTVRQSARTTGV